MHKEHLEYYRVQTVHFVDVTNPLTPLMHIHMTHTPWVQWVEGESGLARQLADEVGKEYRDGSWWVLEIWFNFNSEEFTEGLQQKGCVMLLIYYENERMCQKEVPEVEEGWLWGYFEDMEGDDEGLIACLLSVMWRTLNPKLKQNFFTPCSSYCLYSMLHVFATAVLPLD